MYKLAPIVIFAYKRKKTLELLLNSLVKNKLFFNSKIFIYIDGPANEADKCQIKKDAEFLQPKRQAQLN